MQPGHDHSFTCSLGQNPFAGPAGILIQMLAVGPWREQVMLTRLSITRKEVTLTTDRPLTEAQIEAVKAHCATFERAVEAPAERAVA